MVDDATVSIGATPAPGVGDSDASPRRVVLINNSPAPYRYQLFTTLEERFAVRGANFSVLFWTTAPPTRPHFRGLVEKESFTWDSADLRGIRLGQYALTSPFGMGAALDRLRPELIVSSGCAPPSLLALRWARRRSVPFVLWWGGRRRDGQKFYHPWLHRAVVKRCAAFVTYGSEASDYLIEQGAPQERVHIGLNTRDTTRFAGRVEGLRETPPRLWDGADRELWGRVEESMRGRTNLLVVSRLYPMKNVELALRVMKQLVDDGNDQDARLHVVGGGDHGATLRQIAAGLGLGDDHVVWWGSHPADQIPLFYAHATVALAPSFHETWGFATVEAMASGVPVLSSVWAACTSDVVRHDDNGLALHPEEEAAWIAEVRALLADPARRARLGAAAAKSAREEMSIERAADGFVAAIDDAWSRRLLPA
jgi:glycosyltransferase involved in cell wall biosynthesis